MPAQAPRSWRPRDAEQTRRLTELRVYLGSDGKRASMATVLHQALDLLYEQYRPEIEALQDELAEIGAAQAEAEAQAEALLAQVQTKLSLARKGIVD